MTEGLPLPDVAGAQLVAFVLVLARVGGIFMLAPGFSSKMVPARVKAIVAGAIALAMTPLAERGQTIPNDTMGISTLLLKEIVVGLGFALAIGALIAAVHAGAALLDTMIGFSFSSLVDPLSNLTGGVLSQLYTSFAVIVFFLSGGDHVLVAGLARSYDLLPLGAMPSVKTLAASAADSLSQITTIGLEIAAPVMIALVVTDVALALVARAVPQMNVLFVGLPAKILAGLAVVAASLPFVSSFIGDSIEGTVLHGLAAIRP